MTLPRPLAVLISPVRPDPYGVGLARRAWMWLTELAADHRVLTIVPAIYGDEAEAEHPIAGDITLGDVVVLPARQAAAPADWLAADPELIARLRAIWPSELPARVVLFRLYLLDLLPHLPPAWQPICELDCDDLESATRLSLAGLALRRGRPIAALRYLRSAFAYRAAENRALRQLATVHVAAEEDAAALRRRGAGTTVRVAPNRIAGPLPPLSPVPSQRRPRVLFVGTLNYLPNHDAVAWLAKAIAPRLRRLVPTVEVAVAGAASDGLVKDLMRYGVHYAGAVPGFAAAYADSTIVIAPLRGGGGTKFKILEAWLHGRPVVATPHACRGLGVRSGDHVLVADNADDLAAACAALLANPDMAAAMVKRGRAVLTERFFLGHFGIPTQSTL